MVWQPPGWEADGWQPPGWQPDDAALPPVFVGTIADITLTVGTGLHVFELGAYFSGADSYAINPAVESGWAFDTGTGQLTVDAELVGEFGPFTITATNANGTADSNAFDVTVQEEAGVALGNLGPQFFMPMSESIGRLPEEPKPEPPPESVEAVDAAPTLPEPPSKAADAVTTLPDVEAAAERLEIARAAQADVAALRSNLEHAARRAAIEREEREALEVLRAILAADDDS